MERKFCDLHTHSNYSDGSLTPGQIIDLAEKANLSAVALCDHNTVDGLPDFIDAAEGRDIHAIGGAEFSVDYMGIELHLLGLFIDKAYYSQVAALMQDVRTRKEQSNLELVDALQKVGYQLDYEAIKAQSPKGNVNRNHIAIALAKTGQVPSKDYAFARLLSKDAGYYKEPQRITVFQMLDFLRDIHATPVLAHPYLEDESSKRVIPDHLLHTLLPEAIKRGLAGIEVFYSTYDPTITALAMETAMQYGLLPSGGSDFHGDGKPGLALGSGYGNLSVPYECFLNLQKSNLHIYS